MNAPKVDVARSLSEFFADRRAFLGKAGALSLSAALAALGAPRSVGAFPSVPPPTGLTTLDGFCQGGIDTVTYTPGITNTDRSIHLDGTVTFSPGCAVAQNKTIRSYTYSYDQFASCSSVDDMSGTCTIVYSSGQTSGWTMDSWIATRRIGQYVGIVSGLITNGPFNGDRFFQYVIRNVDDPSLCATAGGATLAHGMDSLIIGH